MGFKCCLCIVFVGVDSVLEYHNVIIVYICLLACIVHGEVVSFNYMCCLVTRKNSVCTTVLSKTTCQCFNKL